MNKEEKIVVIKKYDKVFALTLALLVASQIIIRLFDLSISNALYNFAVTIIPLMFFILKIKIKISKAVMPPIVLISVCRIVNLIINVSTFTTYEILTNVAYDICIIINLTMLYGIIATSDFFKEKYKFKFTNITILVVSFIFCIYNIIHNFNQLRYFSSISYRSIINFSSFFANRNNFGIFLFIVIVSTFYMNIKNKKLEFVIRLFLAFNMFFTLSRTAIISLAIFLILYYALIKNRKKYLALILVLLLLIAFVIINPFDLLNKIETFLVREDEGTSGRFEIWKEGLKLSIKSPVFGYGEIVSDKVLKKVSGTANAHNMYVGDLLVGGIITLASMIWLIIDIIKKDIYILGKDNNLGSVCLATIISMLIYGITEEMQFFYFGTISILLTFYGFIYPTIVYNQMKREEENV